MTTTVISGAVESPQDAATFMNNVATTYANLVANIELSRNNLIAEGVDRRLIDMLGIELDAATAASNVAARSAAEFERQMTRIADFVAAHPDLAGTLADQWPDPAAL